MDMQKGPVFATMGNVQKLAGEMIATAQRDWCLPSAASLRFAIGGILKCDDLRFVTPPEKE